MIFCFQRASRAKISSAKFFNFSKSQKSNAAKLFKRPPSIAQINLTSCGLNLINPLISQPQARITLFHVFNKLLHVLIPRHTIVNIRKFCIFKTWQKVKTGPTKDYLEMRVFSRFWFSFLSAVMENIKYILKYNS